MPRLSSATFLRSSSRSCSSRSLFKDSIVAKVAHTTKGAKAVGGLVKERASNDAESHFLQARVYVICQITAYLFTAMSNDLKQLLGLKLTSPDITVYIEKLASEASDKQNAATPEVKSYPDAVYFNYYALGLSLLFKPVDGYTPKSGVRLEDLKCQNLVLDGVDIYNVLKPKDCADVNASGAPKPKPKSSPIYATYPVYPVTINLASLPADAEGKTRPQFLRIMPETTGKDLVSTMGEPDRKGGGAGPSSGSINIWCEWSKDGIMVEFAGSDSRGPQAWERGKDAVWKVMSIFAQKVD